MEAASQKNQGPHLPPPCFPRMELPEETAGLPENPCWGEERLVSLTQLLCKEQSREHHLTFPGRL